MADNTRPSRAANMEKAEGDRATAEQNLRNQSPTADRGDIPRRYEEDLDREDRKAGDDPTLKTQI